MSKFEVVFFELVILTESCIPPTTIARHTFFNSVINMHYKKMSNEERVRMFDIMKDKLDLNNEDCQRFYARFNPNNQYEIKASYNGDTEYHLAYLFNDKYYISTDKYVSDEYIDKVTQIKK